jgi:D-beta-D-heptose 7-phosphate kinase/D-beta-D-heptose 1-phosphate adenosyltransferase
MQKKDSIIVIGDVMIDCYWHTEVVRVSPEAPVLIVEDRWREYRLGGAANVAANCVSIGATVVLGSVVGDDENGKKIEQMCKDSGIKTAFIVETERPTTVKTRILAKGHQIIRIDSESKKQIDKKQAQQLIRKIKKIISDPTCVVISDYAKGVMGHEIMKEIKREYPKTKIIADIKPVHITTCAGVSCITPNTKEAEEMSGIKIQDNVSATKVAKKLQKISKASVVITRAEAGMTIAENGKKIVHISAEGQEVCDVTGAGDTVVAVLAVFQGRGASLLQSAQYANKAAGKVIGRYGTSVVTKGEIEEIKK